MHARSTNGFKSPNTYSKGQSLPVSYRVNDWGCAWGEAAIAARFGWPLVLLCCLLVQTVASAETMLLPDGEVVADPTTANGTCWAVDLLANQGALPELTANSLLPGRYQARFRLRVSHTADRHIARTRFVLGARQGDNLLAERHVSLVAFEMPGTYQDVSMTFIVPRTGAVTFSCRFAWDGLRGAKRPFPESQLPSLADGGNAGEEEFVLERKLADIPWHLAMEYVAISAPTEVSVEGFTVNKLRYQPGEPLVTVGELINHSAASKTITRVTELIGDMATYREIDRRQVELQPGERQSLSVSAPLDDFHWGGEARVRLLDGEAEFFRTSEYFTVHDNPWAVAIGLYGLQLANYRAGENFSNCARLAKRQRGDSYGNMVEFVFWAEDDFGDLTPTADEYWCGQMRHPGGAEATRRLVDAYHQAGIASSFYARFKVAGGKAGYELYRRHPDWFRPAFYDVSHLDRWHRSAELISWPRLSVRADTAEPYRHHAEEIIRSARDFGWDAIRYDTDMSTREADGVPYPVARYFPETKATVNRALANFQWGFNDALHRRDLEKEPELQELFATLCESGGMIMDEYNNHAFKDRWTYERYAARHRSIRQQVHAHGGNVMLCPSDLDWVNDQVYQAILPLVARSHHAWDPHKGQVPYANYHQFSTRYAGAIWDPRAVLIPGARERLDWGAATGKLFHPHEYAYLRPRGEGRSDLVLHLVNRPPERAASYDDNRVNPPLRDIAGRIALPPGMTARAVFAATAEPELHQATLPFTQADGMLSFTVPNLRFWTMVVVELAGNGRWE